MAYLTIDVLAIALPGGRLPIQPIGPELPVGIDRRFQLARPPHQREVARYCAAGDPATGGSGDIRHPRHRSCIPPDLAGSGMNAVSDSGYVSAEKISGRNHTDWPCLVGDK